jgi:hypothetical protein
VLVREYLLAGQLMDRAGMPHLIGAHGREVMGEIAIDEWMGASPIYTRRTQRLLDFVGDDVETMFKGCSSTSARRRSSWTSGYR